MITISQLVDVINVSGIENKLSESDVTTLFEDLGLDSLDVFNIMVQIQEETGKEVPDEDIEKLQSVQAIYEYLQG